MKVINGGVTCGGDPAVEDAEEGGDWMLSSLWNGIMYPGGGGGGGGADFVGGSSEDPSVDLLLVKSRGFAGSSFLSGSCRS